jgi:hypothetical protein
MTRYIKTLGLALLAVFALGATGASAQTPTDGVQDALESNNPKPTTHLTATSSDAKFSTKTAAITVECETNEAQGTVNTENPATTVTVTPNYEGCTAGFLGEAPVHTEGCQYILHGTTTTHKNTSNEDEVDAAVSIECDEPSDHILITSGPCTLTIGEQGPLHGVTYDNIDPETGKDDVKVTVTVDKIHYTGIWSEENNFLCETLGGLKETGEDGTYTGSFTVKGYEDAAHENQVDIKMIEEDHPES